MAIIKKFTQMPFYREGVILSIAKDLTECLAESLRGILHCVQDETNVRTFNFSFSIYNSSQALHIVESFVIASLGEERLVCATLYDFSFEHHAYLVGMLDGAQTMGDGDGSA